MDATNNNKITDINHLVKLRTLMAGGNCGIDNIGISSLTNLTSFNSKGNDKITNDVILKLLGYE